MDDQHCPKCKNPLMGGVMPGYTYEYRCEACSSVGRGITKREALENLETAAKARRRFMTYLFLGTIALGSR